MPNVLTTMPVFRGGTRGFNEFRPRGIPRFPGERPTSAPLNPPMMIPRFPGEIMTPSPNPALRAAGGSIGIPERGRTINEPRSIQNIIQQPFVNGQPNPNMQWRKGHASLGQDPNAYYIVTGMSNEGIPIGSAFYPQGTEPPSPGSQWDMISYAGSLPQPPAFPNEPLGPSGFTAYDQYMPGGPGLYRGGGGVQSSIRGTPVTQFGRPITENPIFSDVLSQLYNPITTPTISQDIAGSSLFERGVAASTPSTGISPETQRILDIIRENTARTQREGVSAAQSLAAKRGIGGSSIEQFGVQQAIESAARTGQTAEVNALLEGVQRQQALRELQAKGLFERAGEEARVSAQLRGLQTQLISQFGGYDFERRSRIANLTSDELASIRNLQESGNNRALQKYLGERGIQVSMQQLDDARKANERANDPWSQFGSALIGGAAFAIGRGVV